MVATRLHLTGNHCRGVRNEHLQAACVVDLGDRFSQVGFDPLWSSRRDVSCGLPQRVRLATGSWVCGPFHLADTEDGQRLVDIR